MTGRMMIAATALIALGGAHARAQYPYSNDVYSSTSVLSNLDDITHRVEALEAAMAAEADGPPCHWEDQHAQGWNNRWGGRIMADYVNWMNHTGAIGDVSDYFEFRQMRFHAQGDAYGIYEYQFEFELEPEDGNQALGGFQPTVAIRDMYLGINEIPVVGTVLFGNVKVPFSIEQQTSTTDLTFMERALPATFLRTREVGLVQYRKSETGNLLISSGVFFDGISAIGTTSGGGDTADFNQKVSDNQGIVVAARTAWTPYYDEPSDGRYLLHVGHSMRYTHDGDSLVRFRTRPEIHETARLLDTGTLASAEYTIHGLEAAWVHGPLSVQGEYMWNRIHQAGGGDIDLHGAYVYASLFLTGENRFYDRTPMAFDSVKPFENFWMVRGAGVGRGAWELAARWSYLDFSDVPGDAGELHNITAGLNWYMNPYTRMMFNWIHPFANDSNLVGDAEADIFATRLMWDW